MTTCLWPFLCCQDSSLLTHALPSPPAADSSENSRQYLMFKNLRDAMFTRSLRPNRYTHMHVCRGYIRMRDADLALAAFTSMREASGAGGSRLLDRQYLASLLGGRPVRLCLHACMAA